MAIRPQVSIHNQELWIDGCSCLELAKEFKTPVYVLSLSAMEEHFQEIKNDFIHKYPRARVAYAAKAFLTIGMCKIIEKNGLGLDVVSGGELYTAMAAGFPPEKIEVNGNNKLKSELEMALGYNVGRIIVDSADELELLENLACTMGKKPKVLFRITPGVQADSHDYIVTGKKDSKFGFPLDQQLMDVIYKAIHSQNMELLGFHFHIGSQLQESSSYLQATSMLLDLVKRAKEQFGFITREVNVGGGFGIAYLDDDERKPYRFFLDPLMKVIAEGFRDLGMPMPAVVIEPGRSIVGDAGLTLYSVGSIKTIPGVRTYVAVDGGMTDNIRPALYQAKYTAVVANKMGQDPNEKITLCGKACESGDILVKDINLPSVIKGDIIAVYTTGAYGYSMASNYNKIPIPSVVLVNKGKKALMVRRQSMEELVQRDENIEDFL